jgi:hypothetical protein
LKRRRFPGNERSELVRPTLFIREVVQQIPDGLGMHKPVFKHNLKHIIRGVRDLAAEPFPDSPDVLSGLPEGGPVAGIILGYCARRRVNADGKQVVEF